MGRQREVREAEQQALDEAWQCKTCSAPANDDATRDGYCRGCAMYWDDCDAGLFD